MDKNCIMMTKSLMAHAVWDNQAKRLELTKLKGRIQSRKADQPITAQEAIYLLQRGELAITESEVVLSIQECYNKLFTNNFDFDLYLVKSSLSVNGFKISSSSFEKLQFDFMKKKEKRHEAKKIKLDISPEKQRITESKLRSICDPTENCIDMDGKTFSQKKEQDHMHSIYYIYKNKLSSDTSQAQYNELRSMHKMYICNNTGTNLSIPQSMLHIYFKNDFSIPTLLATDCKVEPKLFLFTSSCHVPNAASFEKCKKLLMKKAPKI